MASALATAHLRIARPTDDISALLPFYRDGLGFHVLYEFKDHEGIDGIMLGYPGAAYHLEFTHTRGHKSGRVAPTQDNLMVLYLPEREDFNSAVIRMENCGFLAVASFNPFWDGKGKTFEDPDGYRVVLANMKNPVEQAKTEA